MKLGRKKIFHNSSMWGGRDTRGVHCCLGTTWFVWVLSLFTLTGDGKFAGVAVHMCAVVCCGIDGRGDLKASRGAVWQWLLRVGVLDLSCPLPLIFFRKDLIYFLSFILLQSYLSSLVFYHIWSRSKSCWFFLHNERQSKLHPEIEIGSFSIGKLWVSQTNKICPLSWGITLHFSSATTNRKPNTP